MFQIKGKVALITGGAIGIGLCLARELLQHEAKGVAILDIDSISGQLAIEKLIVDFGENCAIFVHADVTIRSQFEDAFKKTIDTFHQLDIIINNAGIVQELQWEKCIAVNFQGCVTGSLLALDKYFPGCLGTGEGIILNMSSISALATAPSIPVYSGTKYAILGFSRALSCPVRSHYLNVKIITVCPGRTFTSLIQVTKEQMAEESISLAKRSVISLCTQTPEALAGHLVSIMECATTGSVWVVDSNVCSEIQYPTIYTGVTPNCD